MPPSTPTFSTPYVSALRTFYNKASPTYNTTTSTIHAGGPTRLLAALGPTLHPGASLLDLATGTGKVALPAAHAVGPTGHVLGIDISESFLALATSAAEEQGLSSRTTFLQRDVAHLDLPAEYNNKGRWADAITCGSSLAMFPSKRTVLDNLATTVLKPGGKFVADMWAPMIPAAIFLEVAVPRGFAGEFEPEWILDPERAFRELFQGGKMELESVKVGGKSEVRFDVRDEEKVEGLWRNMAEEQTWLSYGLERLGEGVKGEIREAWVGEVKGRRDGEGWLVGEMRQWIAVAVVRE